MLNHILPHNKHNIKNNHVKIHHDEMESKEQYNIFLLQELKFRFKIIFYLCDFCDFVLYHTPISAEHLI